jgi:glycosyltransferase involved in cell wall biosynthesis
MTNVTAFVHAYPGYGHGAGAETTLHDSLRALVADGWDADVVLSSREKAAPDDWDIDGVRVHNYQHRAQPNAYIPKSDVAVTHLECTERTTYIAKQAGVPIVQMVHNTMWQTDGYLDMGCDLAVYNTDWVAEHFDKQKESPLVQVAEGPRKARLSIRQTVDWPSIVLHPAVDPDRYIDAEGPHDHVTLVNLWESKGADIFYWLAERFPNTPFLGVRGGYGEQDIRDLPNVTILENTDRMDLVYGQTKVLLMPSRYESFGRCALEAAASGVPTLHARTPGLLECMSDTNRAVDLENRPTWERTLDALIHSESTYGLAQEHAYSMSDHWAVTRDRELKDFVATMGLLAAEGRIEPE